METEIFKNNSILLYILKESKEESEIKAKAKSGISLVFSDEDSDDRMRR